MTEVDKSPSEASSQDQPAPLTTLSGSTSTSTSASERAHAHLQAPVPESITDFRLFDGKNSPQNIAVYGFGLGALFGASVILATIVHTPVPQFWLFLAALGAFHALEYIAIALFNPTKLKLDCKPWHFFVDHSFFLYVSGMNFG